MPKIIKIKAQNLELRKLAPNKYGSARIAAEQIRFAQEKKKSLALYSAFHLHNVETKRGMGSNVNAETYKYGNIINIPRNM